VDPRVSFDMFHGIDICCAILAHVTTFFVDITADKKVSTSQSLTENDGTESQTLPSTMNEYEQKVWDEWNRQDYEEGSTVGSPTINTVSSEVMERREKAHRQLVQYAEMAKSAVESEESRELPPEEMPTSSLSETTDSDKSASSDDVPPKESAMTPGSTGTFSVSQQRILEKFSSTLKRSAMEVLKLNRGDKRWQTRYLVVSKEVLWLNAAEVNGLSGDRGQCPLGILWTKRFNSSKEYSITSIDRQGRGGVHFDQLVKVSATGRSDLGHPLGKKQQEKFKESVAVCVDYTQNGSPKSVVLLCKTTDEAHFLCTGLRVVMDVLKREKNA
jgi:thymidylate synthase